MRLVLATRNEHKLRELGQLMRPHELDPLPANVALPPETGTTFADNALGKARAAAAATGRPSIADDSGIEAAALGGAPGVWSARYAGDKATDEENLAKLLREVPPDGDTRVAYVCAMAYAEPGGREVVVHGRCEGRVSHQPRGSGGFGYDPAFVPDHLPGDQRTMAELSPEEKDAISHRGRAARALVRALVQAQEAARPRGPLDRSAALEKGAAPVNALAPESQDQRARRRTALLNVVAALLLVGVKLVTGLVTGSLAFVAEAVHSGTDLVAALLTLFAVRVAVRPPDREHHYGHGKAEHLAALGESGFLLLVSLFIAGESLRRLIGGEGHSVDTAWWAFVVLAVVIAVDAGRAVTSRRAARRFGSAALAANALHFASDLAGTLAVLIGLIFVAAGEPSADSVAALFVALLVVIAALRLARQSVDVLMDRAAGDADERIRAALDGMAEPVELRRARVRHAAGRHFADLVVAVPSDAGVTQAHATADAVEEVVERALGGADVVVHVEPSEATGGLRERATAAASSVAEVREVHNVRVMHLPDGYELSLHVKLPRELSLTEAHNAVERLEARVRAEVPELVTVHTHIEPLSPTDWGRTPPGDDTATERAAIEETVRRVTGAEPLAVSFRDGERGRIALVTIALPGDQPLPSAHRHAGLIEEAVRERCPSLADVIVHTEPDEAASRPHAPTPG